MFRRKMYVAEVNMEEKEVLKECYQDMYQGMIEKDRKLLSNVLADSFILVHMTGMRQPKEEFIRAVEDGTLNYYSVGHQEIHVDIQGEKAVLVGKSVVNAAVFGGGRHTWRLQLRIWLARMEGRWKMTEARASTY